MKYRNLKRENQSNYNPFMNKKLQQIKNTASTLTKLKESKITDLQFLDISTILDVRFSPGKIEIVKNKEKAKIIMNNLPFKDRMGWPTKSININENRGHKSIEKTRRLNTAQHSRSKLIKYKQESCQNFRIKSSSPTKYKKGEASNSNNSPQLFISGLKTPNPQRLNYISKNIIIK